jgi:hypothetical protein
MSESDLAARSVAAVTGQVTSIEAAPDAASGGINTYVHLAADEVIFGALSSGPITLREPGGRLRDRSEWIYGSPEYRVGEQVLVFLAENADGTLRTTGMSMGKFSLETDAQGTPVALRRVGEGAALWDLQRNRLVRDPGPEAYDLEALIDNVRAAHGARPKSKLRAQVLKAVPPELSQLSLREHRQSFTFLSKPSRWFEPDDGEPVSFFVDATGDSGIGAANSRAAISDAFSAWTNVPTSDLTLVDAGALAQPVTFGGCDGGNRITFNDAFNEVVDPVGCSGVLAIGGFCASDEKRVVNGTEFRRIRVGKIAFNNGWTSCWGWNRCNLAEVATHEIGHTLGFGHSTDAHATMYASAHFDGRCATLRADDLSAINFSYPSQAPATPSPSATRVPPTSTAPPTRTATPSRTATATRTMTRTIPPTHTAPPTNTLAPTHTATRTAAPPSATPSQPPVSTSTVPVRHRVRGRVQYYSSARGVPDVTVSLRGATQDVTQTSTSGAYEFADVAPGTWELAADKASDFGDAVSPLDAAFVLQTVANLRQLDASQRLACDVTGDGQLSALDATRILQLSVGRLTHLPVGDTCGSDWTFVPHPAAMGEQSVVYPRVAANGCDDGTIRLEELISEAPDQDFHAILFGDCTGNWDAAPAGAGLRRAAARTDMPRIRLGRASIDGRRVSIPVVVRAAGRYNAVDMHIAYDASRLTPDQVVLGRRMSSGLTTFYAPSAGSLRVAMASAEPIKRRFGMVMALEFTLADEITDPGAVQVLAANVDEKPATIVERAAARRRTSR